MVIEAERALGFPLRSGVCYDRLIEGGSKAMPALKDQETMNTEITLSVTPGLMAAIQQIGRESRLPLEEVFTRAIALYQTSLKANAEGKYVGYASSPDGLEVEFTGLTAPKN
jgi:hypothetical protein